MDQRNRGRHSRDTSREPRIDISEPPSRDRTGTVGSSRGKCNPPKDNTEIHMARNQQTSKEEIKLAVCQPWIVDPRGIPTHRKRWRLRVQPLGSGKNAINSFWQEVCSKASYGWCSWSYGLNSRHNGNNDIIPTSEPIPGVFLGPVSAVRILKIVQETEAI